MRAPSGAGRLALSTGAPVLVAAGWREDMDHPYRLRARLSAPLPLRGSPRDPGQVRAAVQDVVTALEEQVAAHYRTVVRDGVEAVVVPPADPTALADGLISVLEDEDRRQRLVAAARQRVEQYAWPRLPQRLLRLYESLGAGDGRAGVTR